ncbi:MAG TPA: DUF177 domain-containing protein, partial [Patescibacteria group bacterium]|nr:DUF177 domain-containing protein [Patescibacteria group bacterium]
FKAELKIRRVEGGDVVRVEGKFQADVVQTCVVSLQDVHAHVDGSFDTFLAEGGKSDNEEVVEFGLDDEDSSPEVITHGQLDMGEVVAQYLALELDPYPRAPGVSLAAQLAGVGGEVKNNPFAVLQKMQKGEGAAAPKSAKLKLAPTDDPKKSSGKKSEKSKSK